MDELYVIINNQQYFGFKNVAVARSMENGQWAFEITATPDIKRHGYAGIKPGQRCQIRVNDDLLLTGIIDEAPLSYDKQGYTISASGRSSVGDLVDCSDIGIQYAAGTNLAEIAVAECDRYGIIVTVHQSAFEAASQPFSAAITRSAGQTIWEFLEGLAKVRAVLLMSNPGGGLSIARAGHGQADTALQLGSNILAAQSRRSSRSLFSQYFVIGQQPAGDDWEGSDASQMIISHVTHDTNRYRPCLIQTDEPVDNEACMVRAEWQQRINWGRSQSIVYTVQGWRQTPGGRLWQPNETVTVTDFRAGLDSTERLITEARLLLTSQGRTTQLTLMPKEAFDLLPLPEQQDNDEEIAW